MDADLGWEKQVKSKVFYWQRSKKLANRRLAKVHIFTRVNMWAHLIKKEAIINSS